MKWQVAREEKLIAFLQGRLKEHSGKFLRKVLDANSCRINGQVERFGSRRLRRGDQVELAPKWEAVPSNHWTFATLYEDESLRIVNKPAGWVCDPQYAAKTWGSDWVLVHRLDKETTGTLLLCKPRVREALFKLFEERQVKKEYLALVDGVPQRDSGEIRSLLAKKGAFQGQTIWGSSPRGLLAITRWKKIAAHKDSALLQIDIETGRTHQIRVHMAEMGHPILVDRQYAREFRCPVFCPRILLHASRLHFSFQDKIVDVTAPLFPDMQQILRDV
ncbi:MAG: RluA family pseudouridine synthase [Verrucomicrobia bacterium]|nr:RluA family pseudouridine synthase [Verrucomicrobiota bacterium]MDE3046784.1 RluA family pseudouridine synthase [Verrucomicrobiota bacterium]